MNPRAPSVNRCLAVLYLGHTLIAQNATPRKPPEKPEQPEKQTLGAIEGTVSSAATGQHLRRAQVVLRAIDGGQGSLFQITDEHGRFAFPNVVPGRYSIAIDRDGFLRLAAGRIGAYKMPPIFMVRPGEMIRALDFRMVAAGVISGKVKFDDAEPALNVVVQLYREFHDRGRHGYIVAASGRTNDLGEYRLGGLEPGAYSVAAFYQGPQRPPDVEEQARLDNSGKRLPDLSYAVTFFPDVQKMSDAFSLRVAPGDEVSGVDIFLTQVRTVRIHGRVTSAISGQPLPSPSIELLWNNADNTGSVSAPATLSYGPDESFEIKGVTPAPYLLVATAVDETETLTARTPITVGAEDIDSLQIVVGPLNQWKGKIRMEGDETEKLGGLVVSLEPRRATARPSRAQVDRTGEFSVGFVPDETYDLYVRNAPVDAYLKSVEVAHANRLSSGLEAAPGDAPPAIDVVLSTRGGRIFGQAVTSDTFIVASGATLMLIPDPADGRVQTYKTGYADEYGAFLLRGVAPGRYVLVAWMDQAPCDVYDPDDLRNCKARGIPVTISEGSEATVQVTAN